LVLIVSDAFDIRHSALPYELIPFLCPHCLNKIASSFGPIDLFLVLCSLAV
jgi:hypothetical protein